MKTVELVQEASADKLLHLTIPVDEADRRYRLLVYIEPDTEDGGSDEWPAGFFERTAGKWTGELIRASQGNFERRESM